MARVAAKASTIALEALARAGSPLKEALELIATRFAKPLSFDKAQTPAITVVLASTTKASLVRSLRSLKQAEHNSLSFEILVLDPRDSTGSEFLRKCSGLRVIPTGTRDMLSARNLAAQVASAQHLLFITDVTVEPLTLRFLMLGVQRQNWRAVSPQIRHRRRAMDSGAMLFRDGSARQYGWNCKPDDPSIAYVREIDFAAHALFVEKEAFQSAGGFGAAWDQAESAAALCMGLRTLGYGVVYDPHAVLWSPWQLKNCWQFSNGFRDSWRSELSRLPQGPSQNNELSMGRFPGSRVVLVIDDYVPMFDRSAGGKRMFELLKLMKSLGYQVTFLPDEGGAHEPYTSILQGLGIEVRYRWNGRTQQGQVAAIAPAADIVWISRPDLCEKYLPLVRRCSQAFTIYDTVDLHHRRLFGSEKVSGTKSKWESVRDLELKLSRLADRTIVTTTEEQHILAQHGITTTTVVPVIEPAAQSSPCELDDRRGLLFVGNYTHRPNVDAVIWFCQEIFPLVQARIPGITLTLAGAEPNARVRQLSNPSINVVGYQVSLRAQFETNRVFVAPLRFGAGIKGKVIEALGNGLPVVSTSVGAEGIPLESGRDALIADAPDAFAHAVTEVYNDSTLWNRLAFNGLTVAKNFSPEAILPRLRQALDFGPAT